MSATTTTLIGWAASLSHPPGGADAAAGQTPPPHDGAPKKEHPVAAPPPLKAKPELVLEPENPEPITDDQQDELIRVATMCGMKTSQLKKLVAERFSVLDMPMMTRLQGDKLLADLRKRTGQ